MVRDAFESRLLDIFGDTRLLWIPRASETTTSTDRSRHAATITYDATKAGAYLPLGSGYYLDFDGTADEADTPDNDRYSFGDGAVDQPFSVVALVNMTDATSSMILAKYDSSASQEEWNFGLGSGDKPAFLLYDDSATAYIGRYDNTTLTEATWVLLVGTYDGSRALTGIRVYLDGTRVDDTDSTSGTYVAMENGAEVVSLGYDQGTGSKQNFFDGKMALVALVGKELTQEEVWAVKKACNSFYDISL